MEEVLPPCVQHRGHADRGPEMLGIGGDGLHRLSRCSEQNIVDDRLVLQGDTGDRRRHGEDEVEIGDWQQLGLAIGEPLRAGQPLALWTVPVAAGVVGDTGSAAVLAALDMAAERRRPAHLNRRHDTALSMRQATGLIGAISDTVAAEDVRHLERGPHARAISSAASPSG